MWGEWGMNIFKKLFSSLNLASIEYMVAGGIAVNLYGIERATADIDIILKLDKENISKFIETARKLGLKPKMPIHLEDLMGAEKRNSWITDKGMTVFSLYDPGEPFFLLDIFVKVPFVFDEVYPKREQVKYEDTVIPVLSMEELIRMKETSNRPQDKADIFYLRKILEGWGNE